MRRVLPPLASLRAFEAAARHMSFKEAAAELGVTPTAISHQVRGLEEACGQPLFRRRPPPLALTAAGARLFPPLRDGLDAFAAVMAAVREAPPAEQPPLRVTATNAFAHHWLVPRLPRWRAAHPGIPLEIIGTDTPLDLRAGEAELAIRYAPTAPMGMATLEILRDQFWPMASPALLAVGPPIRRPGDLLRYPLLHMRWGENMTGAPTWRRWLEAARRLDPELPGSVAGRDGLHFREELHAMAALLAGQGVAICSDVLAADALETGAVMRAFDLPLPGFGFHLCRQRGVMRRRDVDRFSSWLRAEAAQAIRRSEAPPPLTPRR